MDLKQHTSHVTSPDEDRLDSIPDFDRTGRMFAEFLAVRDQKRFQSFVENAVKVRSAPMTGLSWVPWCLSVYIYFDTLMVWISFMLKCIGKNIEYQSHGCYIWI